MTRQSIDRHNFTWLLAALLIFLVAVPLADEVAAGSATVGALIFSLLAVIGIGVCVTAGGCTGSVSSSSSPSSRRTRWL